VWGGKNQAESSARALAQESTSQTDREGVCHGGGHSSSVGVSQSHPEAGLRLREGNCPKSATSPFLAVIAQDNLPQTPKGLGPYHR